MKFYKIRAYTVLLFTKLLSTILKVEKIPLVSVAGLIEKDGKLLFLELSYLKGLGLPGGLIESMETVETGLRREIKEETGLEVAEFSYFSSVTAFFKGYPTLSIVFKVKVEGDTKDSSEGKLVWLDPKEAVGKMAYEVSEKTLKEFLS